MCCSVRSCRGSTSPARVPAPCRTGPARPSRRSSWSPASPSCSRSRGVVGPGLACLEPGGETGGSARPRCVGSLRAVASGPRLRGRGHTPDIDSRHELHAGHAAGGRGYGVRRCARRSWLGVRALGPRDVCRGWSVCPRHVFCSGADDGEAPGRHLSRLVGRDHVAFSTSRRRTNGTQAMAPAVGSTRGLWPGAVVQRPQPEGCVGLSHPGAAVPDLQPPYCATDRHACARAYNRCAYVAAVLDIRDRRRAHGNRHTTIPAWDESPGRSRAGRLWDSNSDGGLSLQSWPSRSCRFMMK